VAQLFETIRAIKDEATRHSLRVGVPIWIHSLTIDHGCLATIAVACPECLRTFPHRLDDANLLHTECCCPHCDQIMQLAMVRPDNGSNSFGIPARTVRSPCLHMYAEDVEGIIRMMKSALSCATRFPTFECAN
jgi:hypothetical protein